MDPLGARWALQSGCPSTQKGGALLCLSSLPGCQDPHASSLTSDQKGGRLCHWKRAILYSLRSSLEECLYPGDATHLFRPLVTHSSATWRRSETLRDRPSPVVPFTVPNRESVSRANQFLLLLQHQHWKYRVSTPCFRGRDGGKIRGWNLEGKCQVSIFI